MEEEIKTTQESGTQQFKLTEMFQNWFLDYSSEVILDRAVPHIGDGLKPVQRRVLHSMFEHDNGELTKAAKIVGQAMAYHPHGDASIFGALVVLGQKGLLIDTQGNWGNILTGDGSAAQRYIECRLSKFAKEVMFNKKTTRWMKSYDGKADEPVELPVKFPLLLAQGAEGIAVGLACKILPHNFNELLDASIAILKNEEFTLYPDFPTGGFADCSRYNNGRRGGVIKVRAKIEKIDKSTIAITEIPFGKTTESIKDSIMKAKEQGKIKVRKIDDLTASQANIQIHLPNDVSPDKTIDALYAFTDCEVSISPNACVIVEGKPEFWGTDDILRYNTNHTKELLGQELRIRLDELDRDWHYSSLERIYFENKIYKILENEAKSWEAQLDETFEKMKEYQNKLKREITRDDILMLVEKPVRKISKFDIKANEEKIKGIEKEMEEVKYNLDNLTRYTIDYFKSIKKRYGGEDKFPRLTEISEFEAIAATKVVSNNAKLYANKEEGFVGMALKKDDNGEFICDCSDLSEILVINKDGKFRVTKVSDKAFFGKDIIHVAVFNRGDTRMTYNVIYKDGASGIYYAKRFAITGITRDKEYDITMGTPGSIIFWFTANRNAEAETVRIYLRPRPKLKKLIMDWNFADLGIKGRASRGNVVSKNPVKSISQISKGVSTIGGKDIWFDEDIQRLNEDSRGLYLGAFGTGDKVLAVFKDGSYYTTPTDLSSRYQGDLLKIEKLDTNKTWSALYYDGEAKSFYIKRFSFEISDNNPMSFISDGKGSYFVELVDDKHPQVEITFGGKNEGRAPEIVNAEEFIAKKGIGAKGKRVSALQVASVRFIEGLHLPEDDLEPVEPDDNTTVDIEVNVPENENFDMPAPEITIESGEGGSDEGFEPGTELTLF